MANPGGGPEGTESILRAGDVIAVSGPREALVETLEAPGSGLRETDDRELLAMRIAECAYYLERYSEARKLLQPLLDSL